METKLARQLAEIETDWSEHRQSTSIDALARDLESLATCQTELAIRAYDREACHLAGELKPVICTDLSGNDNGEITLVFIPGSLYPHHRLSGHKQVTLTLPCLPDNVSPNQERQSLQSARIAQSSLAMARLSAKEQGESWRRDTRQIVGPVKSYLPPMDSEGQLEASLALGCKRNHRPETIQALARCDFNEGERIGKGLNLALVQQDKTLALAQCDFNLDLALVQQNKTLALKVSTYNRRSTRGKGKKCKK